MSGLLSNYTSTSPVAKKGDQLALLIQGQKANDFSLQELASLVNFQRPITDRKSRYLDRGGMTEYDLFLKINSPSSNDPRSGSITLMSGIQSPSPPHDIIVFIHDGTCLCYLGP